jgi:type IV pilus assembly protein PilV
MNRFRRSVRAFSLVEVLVALVVLSVGLLGVATLMIDSIRANGSSYMRTQAALLANSMLDDMRANATAATGGAYTVGLGAPPTCGTVAQCDINAWKTRLGLALPSGDGSIGAPATAGGLTTVQVTVQWDDSHAVKVFDLAGTGNTASLTLSSLIP